MLFCASHLPHPPSRRGPFRSSLCKTIFSIEAGKFVCGFTISLPALFIFIIYLFYTHTCHAFQPPKNWAKKIQRRVKDSLERFAWFCSWRKSSLRNNEDTLILSLKTMVYTMNTSSENFEDLVIGHFQHHVRDVLMVCQAYTEGVQVGCVVKGGVQDVDEGNNSCSPKFKHDVGSYIKTLIAAFEKIGAKEAKNSFP